MMTLLVIISLFLYQDSYDIIVWGNGRSLEWSDYKNSPDMNSWHSASSQCGFNIEYETRADSLFVKVFAYFDKSKSWVKTEKKSDALLSHEQGHFDIAELFARKMRNEMKGMTLHKSNFEKVIRSVFQTNMTSYSIYQDNYDEATSFSSNLRAQDEWLIKIQNSLEAYSNCQDESFLVYLAAEE